MAALVNINVKVPVWLDKICSWPVLEYRRRKFGYPYRRISLGEGEFTILDPQDYYRFADLKWCISGNGQEFYAACFVKIGPGKTKTLRLHREIMNPPPGLLVDHRNTDTLDNRRDNLRLATHSQNSCNRRKRKNTSSRFIGVHLDKRTGQWVAQITCYGRTIHLGCFKSELDAARAYDLAAIKYHGEFAKLNFPKEIEQSPRRLNLRSAAKSLSGRLANWLGARLNFPHKDYIENKAVEAKSCFRTKSPKGAPSVLICEAERSLAFRGEALSFGLHKSAGGGDPHVVFPKPKA